MRIAKCKICGKEFQTNHHSKITCSQECSKKNHEEWYKMLSPEGKQKLKERYKKTISQHQFAEYVERLLSRIWQRTDVHKKDITMNA